jgi:hypothetical protein
VNRLGAFHYILAACRRATGSVWSADGKVKPAIPASDALLTRVQIADDYEGHFIVWEGQKAQTLSARPQVAAQTSAAK